MHCSGFGNPVFRDKKKKIPAWNNAPFDVTDMKYF